MPTDDANDRAYFLERAEAEEITRRFRRLNAATTLALLASLEADVEQRRKVPLDEARVKEIVLELAPLLPAALAAAQARTRADEEVGIEATAKLIGRSKTGLTLAVRTGRSPIPFHLVGKTAKFFRRDVDALMGVTKVDGPTEVLADAFASAAAAPGPEMLKTRQAAALLEMTPTFLGRLVRLNQSPVPATRIGYGYSFRRCDVLAAAAKRKANGKAEVPNTEQAARATRGRR